MIKQLLKISFPFIFFCCLTGMAFYFIHQEKLKIDSYCDESDEEEIPRSPLKDRMDLAWQHEVEITKDPKTGTVPRERLLQAFDYMRTLQSQSKVLGAIFGITWRERGPSNVGGRTQSIVIDPNDPSRRTLWVGGLGGGLWKTTDITASPPIWTPINDLLGNIAISTLAYNPSNTMVWYFGTGEGWFNADAQRGAGIWKSVDGGATWNQLASTNNSNFHYAQKIVVQSNGDVLVATRAGVWESTNGGTTWNRVLGSGANAATDNVSDLEIAANGDIYAGLGIFSVDGVYKSPTGAVGTWTKLNTGANGFPTTGIQRIELACAPSNSNTVFALCQGGGNGIGNLYKTTNGGTSWTAMGTPTDADPGVGADMTRGQAWYDLSMAVDPNNENRLFIGGIDLFRSTNGGSAWSQVAHWYGGFGYQYVHADQHIVLFEPGSSSVAYFGNDGGIYRTTNANAGGTPSIISKSDNLNITMYYACAMDPTANSNQFLAGAQDNGTQQYDQPGIDATVEVTGGDGMFCHIDQNEPCYQFSSYVYNNYFRSTNGGGSFVDIISGQNNTGSFVNPTDYDDANNNLYCCAASNTYYVILNAPASGTLNSRTIAAFNGSVRSVKVSPNTAHRVFFGTSSGRVVRVDNANSGTPTDTHINNAMGMPGGSISCIEVQTGNDSHLLVTYSSFGVNSVWETTNGGTSWTSVEGNLPDMPVRWALFNPSNSTQVLLGTELGVWSTDMLSGAATVWGPSNIGMANTRVDMLQLRASDGLVAAATHGRGLYTSDIFSPPNSDFTADKTVAYVGKNISFIDGSAKATSWNWSFGDATTSAVQNPVKSYSAPGLYTVTLTINGSVVKTVNNYIKVLPFRGTPYTPAAGGNFDTNPNDFGSRVIAPGSGCSSVTNWERGNSTVGGKSGTRSGSFAWVTGLTQNNYADNSDAQLYSPCYNFTAPGAYTLQFYRKNSFEIAWDGYRVEYSLDKGDTWIPLGAVGAGWYDFANTTQNTAFPINEPYFNATVANYTLASYNVSFLAGNANVAFRIRFKSDTNTAAAGVAIDDFEIIGPSNSPLPVELIYFSGSDEKDFNLLKWKTASEINNLGFDVERSATGYGFEKIGFIKGAGTTAQINDYRFEDHDIKRNIYYYRLKQIDFNGHFAYSNVIAVRRNSDQTGIEFIFPNPFENEITLVMNGEYDEPVLVRLFDVSGKKVYENQVTVENYQATLQLSALSLRQGTYFIYIIADREIFTQKLFKK